MKIQGKCKWASIQTPNTTFEPSWSIDIIVDNQKAAELKKLGLKTKVDKDGDLVFKIKRKVSKADGTPNSPPKCVDRQNEPFTKKIGNGSEVIALFSVFEWKNKFGSGVSADFRGVQVVQHVPFGDDEDFEVLEEEIGTSEKKEAPFDDDIPDFL
jgi:hypothetical protein